MGSLFSVITRRESVTLARAVSTSNLKCKLCPKPEWEGRGGGGSSICAAVFRGYTRMQLGLREIAAKLKRNLIHKARAASSRALLLKWISRARRGKARYRARLAYRATRFSLARVARSLLRSNEPAPEETSAEYSLQGQLSFTTRLPGWLRELYGSAVSPDV